MIHKVYEYDECEFKPGNIVCVSSKSIGRDLKTSVSKNKGLTDNPQSVEGVYHDDNIKGRFVYVVRGDYFLGEDLIPFYGEQLEMFPKG